MSPICFKLTSNVKDYLKLLEYTSPPHGLLYYIHTVNILGLVPLVCFVRGKIFVLMGKRGKWLKKENSEEKGGERFLYVLRNSIGF